MGLRTELLTSYFYFINFFLFLNHMWYCSEKCGNICFLSFVHLSLLCSSLCPLVEGLSSLLTSVSPLWSLTVVPVDVKRQNKGTPLTGSCSCTARASHVQPGKMPPHACCWLVFFHSWLQEGDSFTGAYRSTDDALSADAGDWTVFLHFLLESFLKSQTSSVYLPCNLLQMASSLFPGTRESLS